MGLHKCILKTADSLLNGTVILVLCLVGLYAVYALWDNHQVYAEAEDLQLAMLEMKPEVEGETGKASFEELLNINPDVCAWLTLDKTEIDYPILQGQDNMTYINTDVYGNFALAGSIFLDSRCNRMFQDSYSLVYGHHMADSRMFGDLDLYKDTEFFATNRTGLLLLPERTYDLTIFACLVVSSSDDMIFDVTSWSSDIQELLNYVKQKALQLHPEVLQELYNHEDAKVLALSTCSYEFTDARTIVLARMTPHE